MFIIPTVNIDFVVKFSVISHR